MINWDDLRIFLEAVRAGDYSSAGSVLGMNRTTIGRRIQRLERDVGKDIWERGHETERPSGTGAALLDIARKMEEAYAGVESIQTEAGAMRSVRMAGALGLISLLMPEISAAQADTHISVEVSDLGDPVLALQKRHVDLGLAFVSAPPAELEGIYIGRVEQGYYGPADGSNRRIGWSPAAQKAQPLPWTRANILKDGSAVLLVETFPGLHSALRNGLGAAWTWRFLADREPALSERAPPDGDTVLGSASLWLLFRETGGLSPLMRVFTHSFASALRKRIESRPPDS